MKRYPKGAAAVQALKTGKLDCVVIDTQPAEKFVEKNDDLKIISDLFEDEQYAICLKKGNTELQESMNQALAELKEEGTLDKIISNYIGDVGSYQYESPADADHSKENLSWQPTPNLNRMNITMETRLSGLTWTLRQQSVTRWVTA